MKTHGKDAESGSIAGSQFSILISRSLGRGTIAVVRNDGLIATGKIWEKEGKKIERVQKNIQTAYLQKNIT